MTVLRSPLRSTLRSPLYSPLVGKWGGAGAPQLQLSATTIAEDAVIGTTVGTLSVSNLADGVTVSSYAVTADPDSKFAIDNDTLITNATLDFGTATSHSVTVTATLSNAATVEGTFTINVTEVVTISAPSMTAASDGTDTTPDLDVDLPVEAAAGDTLRIQVSVSEAADWSDYVVHVLTSQDIIDDEIVVPGVSELGDGDYDFRSRVERGLVIGDWSNTVTHTVGTAPASPPAFVTALNSYGGVEANTTLPVTLHADIEPDDIILIVWHGAATLALPGTPSGFTLEASNAQDTASQDSNTGVYWKIATGSETDFNIVHASAITQGYMLRIIRDGIDLEAVVTPQTTGAVTNPDPASITPSWGSAENLWIAGVCHARATPRDITGYPSGYADNQLKPVVIDAASGLDIRIGICSKLATGASDDPGTFTLAASGFATTFTIAVRPA